MRSRLLVLVLAAGLLTALVLGTSGFTSSSMNRPVAVTVSDNDQALVTLWNPGSEGGPAPAAIDAAGLDQSAPVTTDGQVVTVVGVVNRFENRTITVEANVTDAPPGVIVGSLGPVTLGPGAAAPLEAPVTCGSYTGPASIGLTVRAYNDGFEGVIGFRSTVVCSVSQPMSTATDPTTTNATTTNPTTN